MSTSCLARSRKRRTFSGSEPELAVVSEAGGERVRHEQAGTPNRDQAADRALNPCALRDEP
jgi:hypothetical protein